MAEQLLKLSPDRDLQCYFFMPSAIAAISGASASGFTVSGKWRQQFDWAVAEWNRDNVFEHPALRYLPDGDLSGLVLTYQEQRIGCVPIESNLVPTVSWNTLRIWTDDSATPYEIELAPLATPVVGAYVAATGTMTLKGSPGAGQRVGLAWLERHYYYTVQPGDSLSDIARGIAQNVQDADFTAVSSGASVQITWQNGPDYSNLLGANGNRITVYGFAQNGADCWTTPSASFSGGVFPSTYQISIDFGALKNRATNPVPTDRVRKLRWTWAADFQPGSFEQTEFQVIVSNWTVSGSNRSYSVAGPGSFRVEDTDGVVSYSGSWVLDSGNYSDSRIHYSTTPGASVLIPYMAGMAHNLYLGTRRLSGGATLQVSIDGGAPVMVDGSLNGEDILVRWPLGTVSAGQHQVSIVHAGPAGAGGYFDFVEIAVPSLNLPDFSAQPQLSLATDWDTYHSQSLSAERTAWMIQKMGFHGRVNHYTGALWFYELLRPGTQYASLALEVVPKSGAGSVALDLATGAGQQVTTITHLVLPDDTAETAASALAALINNGTNLLWASASGTQLTLTARAMGTQGNGIWAQANAGNQGFTLTSQSNTLSGGIDGNAYSLDRSDPLNATLIDTAAYWATDLNATPRMNRAARDWHAAFFKALKGYGLDCVAAFSTELMNGDPSAEAGIAQRYPDGTPVVLNTPSIQTNFSPTALNYWVQVYLDMAGLQQAAGLVPYLQSGEVQWWYFPKTNVGMPFYDAYTLQQYQAQYGSALPVIPDNLQSPAQYGQACIFLANLIGGYTASIRASLRQQYPGCRYEVLYPTDTNNYPITEVVNFTADWSPQNLTCLKTESFGFTAACNLDLTQYSMNVSAAKGFSPGTRSHLVGVGASYTPWMKEVVAAQAEGLESVVLFALDQYCLAGYPAPPFNSSAESKLQG